MSIAGIGERNTVSNGPDSGANNQMAPHFWNCKRHGSTQQAVDNGLIAVALKTEPPQPRVTSVGGMSLGGHGHDGMIETGMGQTGPFDTAKVILQWNQSAWGPQIERLVPTPITMLAGTNGSATWGHSIGRVLDSRLDR